MLYIVFLFQQNMWVRYGAVGFVAAVARTLNIADVHCNLLPLLQPFLKQPVVQVDQEVQNVTSRLLVQERASLQLDCVIQNIFRCKLSQFAMESQLLLSEFTEIAIDKKQTSLDKLY